MTSDEISEHYRTHFPQLGEDDFLYSWNSMLLEFPEYRLKFIQKLSEAKDYKLILLSNTNENHIEYIKNNVPFYEDFKNCFDAFYLSHEIGMRKPNPDIFELVLDENELEARSMSFYR